MSLSSVHPSAIGKVYFIRRNDAQSVKIGFTHGAVEKRLRTLQLSNSAPLIVMRTLRGTHSPCWRRWG